MKKKALVSSFLIIALCASIIAGSTFALFTSESSINVAVTSGTVDVQATILEETLATSSMGVATSNGVFANGGTALFTDAAKLELTNITPGDKAAFTIQVKNNSNVDVQYRVKWAVDGELYEALVATADGEALVDNTTDWAKWAIPQTDAEKVKNIAVEVELPVATGNDYQDKTASIMFTVEAVQGNGIVTKAYTEDQLRAAIELGNSVEVMKDIALTNGLTIPANADMSIILNGNKLSNAQEDSSKYTRNVIVNNGNLTLVGPGTLSSTYTYSFNNNGTAVLTDVALVTGGTYNAGDLVLNNVTVENTINGRHGVYNSGSVEINGGTYSSTAGNELVNSANTNAVINGGTFTQIGKSYLFSNNVTLKDGTFNGYVDENGTNDKMRPNVYVYGGTFNFDPTSWIVEKTYFEATANADGTYTVTPKEGVTVAKDAATLESTLTEATDAGSGDSTVYLLGDVDLTGTTWTPISVDGYHGAGVVTVLGNGATIKGLTAPLFAGGFAGKSGIIIKDLTIADSTIAGGTQGGGAFIDCADSMHVITVENCHVVNSTITGERVGGIIGWCSGYAKLNDGPVKANVTVKDCSVTGCEIIAAGSAGGIAGHPGASDYTWTTIENCSVKDTSIHSNDDGGWRVGAIVGTANNGHVVIKDCATENVTLSQVGKTAPVGQNSAFGRFVPSGTGTLNIDGAEYVADATALANMLKSDAETVSVVLTADVTVKITDLGTITGGSGEYKLGGENTKAINIDLGGKKLTISTTYWSNLGAKNPDAVFTIKNGSMTSSQTSGTWNSYDLTFSNCDYVFENVVFDKAVAFDNAGKNVKMTNVTINETHDYYALWITADGQTVTLDNVIINSLGRGIKIDEQYVDSVEKVTLTVKNNSVINSKNKAAIIVKSAAGADIIIEGLDITNAAADTVNAVWVDEDAASYADLVTVTGGTVIVEP